MAENLLLSPGLNKKERYKELIPQINAIVEDETDLVANLANLAAILKEGLGYFWVGFYLFKENMLVLGPFQGPLACTRIAMGKGVCGTAAEKMKPIVVPDVHEFPGHIACSSLSKSEIVVPLVKNGQTVLVLDIDSESYNSFDETDVIFLQQILNIIELKHYG